MVPAPRPTPCAAERPWTPAAFPREDGSIVRPSTRSGEIQSRGRFQLPRVGAKADRIVIDATQLAMWLTSTTRRLASLPQLRQHGGEV